MIKTVLLKLLKLYQRFFTVIGYGSCRYYPSCSEYAKWQVEHNPLYIAFFQSFLRILRCNQLFAGGIDYPILHQLCKKPKNIEISHIKYWLVPKNKQRFFIIKNFNFER